MRNKVEIKNLSKMVSTVKIWKVVIIMSWFNQAKAEKENFIKDLQQFLQIPSVLDEASAKPGAPFGDDIRQALEYMLNLGKREGFITKNIEGYAGHLEWGTGEELIGILCHVDVVPEGDHWDMSPYAAEVRDGRIYARGAQDDKGPTMAAFYALKILKDSGIPFMRRVRIIFGTDEESEWRCVNRYFETEEMPMLGFAPDASFPMIYAEKGISDAIFTGKADTSGTLLFFAGGNRLNMVPDKAYCILCAKQFQRDEMWFTQICAQYHVQGHFETDGKEVKLSLKGVSAHGSEPQRGKNAVTTLAHILHTEISDAGLDFLARLHEDFYGEKNGFVLKDTVSGALTLNVGKAILQEGVWEIGANIRYPVTVSFDKVQQAMENLGTTAFRLLSISNMEPLYIPADHPLVTTLLQAYEAETWRKDPLGTTGGGTYARALKTGVAFGALFPDEEELYHQRNESASIDGLIRAIAIYARAIYALACKKND